MANRLFHPSNKNSVNQKFREKRFGFFLSQIKKIKENKTLRILDVGGTDVFWERMNFPGNENVEITLLNLDLVPVKNEKFISLKGDGCDLSQFKDEQFDVVFSNSVIEHVFTMENQIRMAKEARRVGKYYYIQTPNRYFPIEPHWLFPFFQFFPFKVKVFLTMNFTLGHFKKGASKENAIKYCNEIKLLSERDMKKLFPEGKVYREKFSGLVKSITMYNFPLN